MIPNLSLLWCDPSTKIQQVAADHCDVFSLFRTQPSVFVPLFFHTNVTISSSCYLQSDSPCPLYHVVVAL
jgi:hypothetical protein